MLRVALNTKPKAKVISEYTCSWLDAGGHHCELLGGGPEAEVDLRKQHKRRPKKGVQPQWKLKKGGHRTRHLDLRFPFRATGPKIQNNYL